MPEDERLLMRAALNRIKDIANNLLEKKRDLQQEIYIAPTKSSLEAQVNKGLSTVLLPSLVDPLITEKRTQYRSQIGISIDCSFTSESYGLFSNVQPVEFKRLLSNLINNSVEAIHGRGSVRIGLRAINLKELELTVEDTGAGISADVLKNLGQWGATFGKAGGSGLGLYHAKIAIEAWGGSLNIVSTPLPDRSHGTKITIILPRAPAPEWFVSELNLSPGSAVLVFDDDPSIHWVWQGRFESLRFSEFRITSHHYSSPSEVKEWFRANPEPRQIVLLADYELLGSNQSGLDVIEELGVGENSILVTSRFEERHISERAVKLGVKLIPKSMAAFVPINVITSATLYDAILIDDDELMQITWAYSAKTHRKRFTHFFSKEEFLSEAYEISKQSPIYIDALLKDNIRGEAVASEIAALGFTKLFLATGLESTQFDHLLKPRGPFEGITGKNPPWLD